MLRSKIQCFVKLSFAGCCEAKSSILKSVSLPNVAKQNPVYIKAELSGFFLLTCQICDPLVLMFPIARLIALTLFE
jgi:hypothetical protein